MLPIVWLKGQSRVSDWTEASNCRTRDPASLSPLAECGEQLLAPAPPVCVGLAGYCVWHMRNRFGESAGLLVSAAAASSRLRAAVCENALSSHQTLILHTTRNATSDDFPFSPSLQVCDILPSVALFSSVIAVVNVPRVRAHGALLDSASRPVIASDCPFQQ